MAMGEGDQMTDDLNRQELQRIMGGNMAPMPAPGGGMPAPGASAPPPPPR